MALASFPPILALPSSSKEIWDARPAPVLALLCSAQVAGKIPLHVTLCPGCPQGCVPTHQEHPQGHGPLRGWGHLRSRGDNDTAHPVEATVSQVQALSSELHLPALEVLLVEDNDLGVQGKGWMRTGMLREGRLVLCDPACLSPLLHASPGLSKPSCRFSHLVPAHAELGSVHGHALHRLSTGRFPQQLLLLQDGLILVLLLVVPTLVGRSCFSRCSVCTVAFSAWNGVTRALLHPLPPSKGPCYSGMLTWHHCGNSVLALSPLVSLPPPRRTPACKG